LESSSSFSCSWLLPLVSACASLFLRPSELVTPSLALQNFVIIFQSVSLYLILKWRHHRPVIAPLGWVAPNVFYSTVASFAGIASALSIAFLAHLRHQVLPSIPAADFLILGLLLGPILEESVFRGCLRPVVARRFGSAFSVLATPVLFAAFHVPTDVIHWIWFSATGVAYGWLRLASQMTTAAALMHATCNLALFLAAKF
jgi:membrane protease YdiL (CAAX protease family)